MKFQVKVQDRLFEVKIENLHSQPIIVDVDGEPLEVWVESHNGVTQIKSVETARIEGSSEKATPRSLPVDSEPLKRGTNSITGDNNAIRAPIPGTIISVAARQGSDVTIGQELCILEAMKMKNAIRSPRNGVIASVHVTPGQIVQHHDVLVEFVD